MHFQRGSPPADILSPTLLPPTSLSPSTPHKPPTTTGQDGGVGELTNPAAVCSTGDQPQAWSPVPRGVPRRAKAPLPAAVPCVLTAFISIVLSHSASSSSPYSKSSLQGLLWEQGKLSHHLSPEIAPRSRIVLPSSQTLWHLENREPTLISVPISPATFQPSLSAAHPTC